MHCLLPRTCQRQEKDFDIPSSLDFPSTPLVGTHYVAERHSGHVSTTRSHLRNDNMALRVLPETKYWELAEYKFVTNNGDRIYHGTQRNRIAERHLQAHGAHAPDQATLQRLMYLVRRLDRDFLSYGNCSGPELKVFADARGIEYPQDRKRMKKEMVRALEGADDDARFIRIMDLPAELRVRIYEYYCLDLGIGLGSDRAMCRLNTHSRH